jgi:site-specific DNA-methyltransferase (adenine-specific)
MGIDMTDKTPAPRNKTLTITDEELRSTRSGISRDLRSAFKSGNEVVNGDFCELAASLPSEIIDLAVIDPPYNLTKIYDNEKFKRTDSGTYEDWVNIWMPHVARALKPNGSIYVCSDWDSSSAIHAVLKHYFKVRNRITWERDKGRGALRNWKNNCEDVWFCTKSDEYTFNLDAVKVKKKIIAPYKDASGMPKDWTQDDSGSYRMTAPSNVWTDITVPFWSMPENTEHPTQKPEKLIAKLVLASSNVGDIVFDPFLGSGTTAVVAKKLSRQFVGVEISERYCALALKRLLLAQQSTSIQGFDGTFFHERNAAELFSASKTRRNAHVDAMELLAPELF